MALLCSSRWSNQKCCKTERVALKTGFLTRNVSSLNPFPCKIQIFKVRVKVSYFYKTLKIFNDFSRENHGHGVATVLCKKPPIFGSRQSKLDHLTVYLRWLLLLNR